MKTVTEHERVLCRAQSGERVRLGEGLRRNPHLGATSLLETYIEADLVGSRWPRLRAIWLSIRYPQYATAISVVASNYGMGSVFRWPWLVHGAAVGAVIVGIGAFVWAQSVRGRIDVRREAAALTAQSAEAEAEADEALEIVAESRGILRARLESFEAELAGRTRERYAHLLAPVEAQAVEVATVP